MVPLAVVHAPPSTETATDATPTLSEDDPLTVVVPLTLAPADGAEIAMRGAVVSVQDRLHPPDDVVGFAAKAAAEGATTTATAIEASTARELSRCDRANVDICPSPSTL